MMLLIYAKKSSKYYLGVNKEIAVRAITNQAGADLHATLGNHVYFLAVADSSVIKSWRKCLSPIFINQPDPFHLGEVFQTIFPELLL